jgi:hypothetical protein
MYNVPVRYEIHSDTNKKCLILHSIGYNMNAMCNSRERNTETEYGVDA